jgi:hypothetical protein
VANYGNNKVGVLLGNGDGAFQPARFFAVGVAPASVAGSSSARGHTPAAQVSSSPRSKVTAGSRSSSPRPVRKSERGHGVSYRVGNTGLLFRRVAPAALNAY